MYQAVCCIQPKRHVFFNIYIGFECVLQVLTTEGLFLSVAIVVTFCGHVIPRLSVSGYIGARLE